MAPKTVKRVKVSKSKRVKMSKMSKGSQKGAGKKQVTQKGAEKKKSRSGKSGWAALNKKVRESLSRMKVLKKDAETQTPAAEPTPDPEAAPAPEPENLCPGCRLFNKVLLDLGMRGMSDEE
eukprot:TRINITY_DN51583_c0_g1_i1.p1 TRINITY_DN51583_c0_g1~~TRINITY_DN51583_c0_g1_i1.p1  ORF type:complete len:121 (+),score=39.06 TRINITY_DN51583_c0_g1_i1:95-457(+)